jgi:hypothetical protein
MMNGKDCGTKVENSSSLQVDKHSALVLKRCVGMHMLSEDCSASFHPMANAPIWDWERGTDRHTLPSKFLS